MEPTRGTVVVAGGSGLVGRALVEELHRRDYGVVVLTRKPERAAADPPLGARAVGWDGPWHEDVAGAAAVVNLAGASIGGGRWTRTRKERIRRSRVDTTTALVEAVRALEPERRPRVLVNASGIDYAGDRGDEPASEDVEPGDSFLADVCVDWEAAAHPAEELGVRVVLMRTAFVFGRGGPAVRLLALPFRLFVGGRLGSGRQWFPWISLADAVGLYVAAIEDERLAGRSTSWRPSRCASELARELGRVLHRPSAFPTPAPVLRLALGEAADLLLHGQRAEPRKALDVGYAFRHPMLRPALEEAF